MPLTHARPRRRLAALTLAAALLAGGGTLVAAPAHAAPAAPAPAAPAPAATSSSLGLAGVVAPAATRSATSVRRGVVALTFDDGPSSYTPQVLTVLRRHKVRATFFALGSEVRRYPATARRVVAEGHRIANHTLSHPDLRTLSDANIRTQVLRTQTIIRQATRVTPTSFRFPYGAHDARTRAVVQSCGLRYVQWNIDPRDWSRPGPRRIRAHVVDAVRKDRLNIVLMHDGGGNRANTVAALDSMIRALKARGYTFGIV